ncbi:vacuolar protein sorting-associated protein 13B [Diachasma alloeum]|uniref:vacuolar protein sorting-associated protein 13B n=1 Tax=Diachasma alloeum TaxID=454923 RepID=UPI00073824D7|nr:vacuolar protein sorting-associated protein 13B [Diachasma alloeum]
MFKLESYITPVLLNYVGKYVKNFRPEQSQVSLWGGDATFQNLDLRLNVLNEQFDLPFSFVSGHIHELLIHVPWVKITSEPIVITINTIECILKMNDGSEKGEDLLSPRSPDSFQEDTPPGYMRSIVTKVVNNITINCNNLILKFVEEDIVLSVNIRFLSMQTVDDSWQPTFADVNGNDMILRKVISIEDLTLCLDKMDSSGKIDIYQDPVVYRCSMTIRAIMNCQSSPLNRSTITRFDMHCSKMEFSITEQQIPMLLRLISMLMALQSKRALTSHRRSSITEEIQSEIGESDDSTISSAPMGNSSGWGTWAWNAVASVLPVDWDDELSMDQPLSYIGHTVHFGVYIEEAILTLKTVETIKESFSHKSMKIRYRPFLTLRLSGVVAEAVQQGITVTAYRMGIGSVLLSPRGNCSCGFVEVKASAELPQYFLAGNSVNNYLKDSLFDEDFTISGVVTREYSENIQERLSSDTRAKEFFKNCPAFCLDFVHLIQLPEEIKQDELFDLARNFEYSNFQEREATRLFVGDLEVRICSGVLHRLPVITSAIEKSDILNCIPRRVEPAVGELPPVTVEEYESLNEFVPMTETSINVSNLSVQFQLADHRSHFRRKFPLNKFLDYPRLLLNLDHLQGEMVAPMYSFRLAACASKQRVLSEKMLSQCYKRIEGTVSGFTSLLYLSETSHTSLIMPCSLAFSTQTLIYPQYWVNIESINIPRETQDCRLDNLTVTTTKAKFTMAHAILTSIFWPEETGNPLFCSSLFHDAFSEVNATYLELSIEGINYSSVILLGTFTKSLSVGSVRIFALNDDEQAFVLSGPEGSEGSENIPKLLSVSVRYPKNPEAQEHAVIVSLRVSQTRASLDPLLLDWLQYQSIRHETEPSAGLSDNHGTEETSSDTSTRKKTFPSLHENVHSPSEKDRKWNWILEASKQQSYQKSEAKANVGVVKRVTNSYFWWKRIGVICCVEPLVMYMPSRSLDGIGMNGIEESKERAMSSLQDLQIFVIKTAHLTLHSANFSPDQLLNDNFSISSIHQLSNNFPWALSLTDFHCYTLSSKNPSRRQLNFLRMESLNATIDATIKQHMNSESSLNTLGFCIYVDTSPITISCSDSQIKLINEILDKTSRIVESHVSRSSRSRSRDEQVDILLVGQPQALQSPPILCTEETDTTSTTSTSRNESENEESPAVMTAWIQWTITKVSVKLYTLHPISHVERKMVMELEDIITSLDWQPIYIQLKNKVTTATVFHYVRSSRTLNDHWRLGEFSGIIMCPGEQDDLVKGIQADDFLTVTVTRAKSNNVYNKWSSYHKHHKTHKNHYSYIDDSSLSSYITEVVVKLQILEVILPMDVIRTYVDTLTSKSSGLDSTLDQKHLTNCSRQLLPLIYADFKGVTLVFPVSTKRNELQHDTIVVRTEGISVNPHAENPICRVIHRPDIYELAAQANILSTPGSAVEDRQYEIKINDILTYSTSWIHRQVNLTKRNAQASLYTMNENPALEWNNMIDTGDHGEVQCLSLTSGFDVCSIVAPPIIYKSDTIVCGTAVEITCLTDIDVAVNLEQIKLITMLAEQLVELSRASGDAEDRGDEGVRENGSPHPRQQLVDSPGREGNADRSGENQREYGQDSGVDVDMSSTDVGCHLPSLGSKNPTILPFEYLMNFGKISITIYENSRGKSNSRSASISPLIHLLINQPNTYISQQSITRIFQVNCFDISMSFPDENRFMEAVPTAADFKRMFVETKNGEPHPNTGIPPSFAIVRIQSEGDKKSINVDMGRPTRMNFSLPLIDLIDSTREKLLKCFRGSKTSANSSESPELSPEPVPTEKNIISNLPNVNITTKQMVLALKSDTTSELILSMSSLSAGLTSKPRRMNGTIALSSAMITTNVYGSYRALLSPMSGSFSMNISWESWHDPQDLPQTKIQAYSEHIHLDVGPEQLRVVRSVQRSLETLSEKFLKPSMNERTDDKRKASSATEQHYQDDLKVGAFQFIDGTADDMPLPYQVIFSRHPSQSMVWRYPQPRILTRLHMNEALQSIIDDTEVDFESILCVIEFWSESLSSYQRYIEFPILEIKKPTFKLPSKFPTRAVACVWRLTLHSGDLDSRTLAGCLRIDSYFNSSLVSAMEVTLNVRSVDLAFYNHIDTSVYRNLSSPLEHYKLNNIIPSTQVFAIVQHRNVLVVFNKWEDSVLVDLSGSLSIDVMDYAYLRMQRFLQEVAGKIQVSRSDHTNVVMMWQEVSLRFGPEVSHTLTLSFSLWNSALEDDEKIMKNEGVILSRIVVANNCNVPVRFGQSQSPDDILLQTSECHFYTWCHSGNKSMRIATKNTGWLWSRAFNVRADGVRQVVFDKSSNSGVHVNVKSLSPTQKLITFWGQLIVCNSLIEDFELRLLRYDNSSKTRKIVSEDGSYVLTNRKPLSMIIDQKENFAIRLRFLKSPNSWTGDIPLHANAKCDQPWLVKVPHQGKDKFLSIWVRIVQESSDNGRILVILSPLYMVRSFLPVDVGARLETPTLSSSFDTTIPGCGEVQQVNCPGTFENYHQLTFHSNYEISTLQTSIPVSYNCVDQRSFFKRSQREDVDQILEGLYSKVKPRWPLRDEDENVWRPVKQGRTHAFIRYQDAGLVSSTLLFEIRPWCYIMNSLGWPISIVSSSDHLVEIPHLGVAAPPKLDGIFHLQIEIDDELYDSTALQLANSEWNRGFIMPQISGLIPVDGTIRVSIDCKARGVCSLVINSSVQEEIRMIRVMSSHIFCNFTSQSLRISTLSASLSSSGVDVPEDLELLSRESPPSAVKREGIPISQWYQVAGASDNPRSNESPFLLLNAGFGWSCPSRVEPGISRNCVAVPFEDTSIPLVITTQKDKEVTYVVASHDEHPQLVIMNTCSFDLIVRQVNPGRSNVEPDAPPFTWACEVPRGKSRHYSTPNVGRMLPDAANARETKCSLHLSSRERDWFKVIDLPVEKPIRFDQYVQMDSHRDLKIVVESRGHSVHITVEPKSEIEVSVKDIRSRLLLEGPSPKSSEQVRSPSPREPPELPESSSLCLTDGLFDNRISQKSQQDDEEKFLTLYVKGVNLVISLNTTEGSQRVEVASFYLLHTIINVTSTVRCLSLGVMIGDLQFDNQMFDQGGFDFPVVLISQKPSVKPERAFNVTSSLENCIAELRRSSLFSVECLWERIEGKNACKSVHVRVLPINIYIEDKYVTQLLEYATSMVRPCCIMSGDTRGVDSLDESGRINAPTSVIIDAGIMSSPLRIQSLMIEPISILLSVHTSVRLYVALDHSPLHFGVFERENLFTTPYRLGNALTMHYLSGAIFGAGWVVGSLEILGSPGSFAQALGSGLKDFIALPFQGLLQGPWGFVVGVTHGSASLMRNITAGTVNSVTKLASSVARNLDRLTLDEEHVQRQEESRRTRPQGMAQGLYQGLTGFGISILAAVAGLAHHPLQNLLNGETSAKGLMTGVGLGLVGVVTKPLSGAAELVALTGQGLLQRTGWNSLPSARRQSSSGDCQVNSFSTRYVWKLASLMLKNCDNILYLTDAEFVDNKGNRCDVTIVVTRHDLLVVNRGEDKVYKLFGLRELSFGEDFGDDSSLRLSYSVAQQQKYQSETPSERLEMDQEMRSRVEQYVISSSGLVSLGESEAQSSVQATYSSSFAVNSLNFYLESSERNYLRALMSIVKRQSQGIDFTVL